VKLTFPTQAVADFFTRHALAGTSGVVALSGGPDSVCLASILRELQGQGSLARLVLAHLNHQLRGAASAADEEFVITLARDWGVACRTQRLEVAQVATQSGGNLEETARRLRYDWLTQIAREEGASWVATGHSADDQAETVLFRLLRGSGLHGLAGMAERRALAPGVDLLRPLLDVRRHAVLAYLAEQGQGYREDASNQDLRLTRNRLRHELLPTLAEHYNPAIKEILVRLATQARQAQEEMDQIAGRLLVEAERPRAGDMIVLDAQRLAMASRHLRREMFRLIWRREEWPAARMTFDAWDQVALLVEEDAAAVDLPAGIRARRVGRVIQLERVNSG
jgi:tRNA(Ile)-lysidine synthase